MLNFEYRGWARWGVGSSATLSADTVGWDLRFSLRSLDPDTAVVGVDQLTDAFAIPLGKPPDLVLNSDSGTTGKPPRKHKTRTPVEKIVRPQHEPETPPMEPVAEGDEILEVAGEEFFCRWGERRGSRYGKEYSVKIWTSEKVPGGIVRVEANYPVLGGTPGIWMLKSFEKE